MGHKDRLPVAEHFAVLAWRASAVADDAITSAAAGSKRQRGMVVRALRILRGSRRAVLRAIDSGDLATTRRLVEADSRYIDGLIDWYLDVPADRAVARFDGETMKGGDR